MFILEEFLQKRIYQVNRSNYKVTIVYDEQLITNSLKLGKLVKWVMHLTKAKQIKNQKV